ncbi:MAG: hydroxypyruvate isomerase family protein [Candidatus Brocadiia bacterium]
MNRRDAVKAAGLGLGAALGAGLVRQQAEAQEAGAKGKFQMKYAPHFGMFRHSAGNDPLDQLRFAAERGFHAWEDNGMSRKSPELQTKIGKEMERLGMTMGVFVSGLGNLVDSPAKLKDQIVQKAKGYIEVAKRVNATWTTVVPGRYNPRLEWAYQTANVVENLKVAAGQFEPAGLVMVLEPLNWWANHPGLFLHKVPQAYQICKAVGSPSCKILDDLYHAQIQEGNLIPNMEKAWSEIAYIQVGDNPGRKEPTTGEINYRNIFKWLHDKGYEGLIGMEHGNSKPGKEGEEALIAAYRACDDF